MSAVPARFCPRHRVAIGPRGCPRCEQAERIAHREEQRGFWRWAAWASLPLLVVGAWAALRPQRVEPDRLDPEPYRRAIETAESVLYREDRLSPEDRSALGDALQALSQAMQQSVPSVALRRAIQGTDRYLGMTAVMTRDETFDVVRARQEWERLRGLHFVEAEWFRHGSMALMEAQTSSAARGIPEDVDRYDRSLEGIRFLAERAQTYLEMLPEAGEDVDGDTYERWQSQKQEMAAAVERVNEGFPLIRPPHEIDPAWGAARSALDNALRAVSRMCGPDPYSPSLVPNRNQAEFRAGSARSAIQRAQEAIDRAPR